MLVEDVVEAVYALGQNGHAEGDDDGKHTS